MRPQMHLPKKRSKYWLAAIFPMVILMDSIMSGITIGVLGRSVAGTDIMIFSVLSVIASIIVFGFAYAGQWIASGGSMLGVLAGLFFMGDVYTKPVEWVGIVGLVSGAQLFFVFFLISVCVQMLCYLSNKGRKEDGGKNKKHAGAQSKGL